MPLVCYNKPNRTKRRPFNYKALCRIAKYVQRDEGLTGEELIIRLMSCLGMSKDVDTFIDHIETLLEYIEHLRTIQKSLGDVKQVRAYRRRLVQLNRYLRRARAFGFRVPRRMLMPLNILGRFLRWYETRIDQFEDALSLVGKVEKVITGYRVFESLQGIDHDTSLELPPPDVPVP